MENLFKRTGAFLLIQATRSCPACNNPYLDRIERRSIDRFLSVFIPVKRYECPACKWVGNLRVKD